MSDRTKRKWSIAKKTITQQRHKIQQLTQRNRRLEQRVYCLKSLLAFLRKQAYISESAETIIQVSLLFLVQVFQ